MRMQPVDRPRSVLVRLAFWISRRRFGRVLMPLRVLYARRPALLRPYLSLLNSTERAVRLEPSLRILLKWHIASLNGCSFCVDMAQVSAREIPELRQKLAALGSGAASEQLSPRERAALAYAEEVTRDCRVTDSNFERLRVAFSEEEIVEVTWLVAAENFLNRTTVPLQIEADGACTLPSESAPSRRQSA